MFYHLFFQTSQFLQWGQCAKDNRSLTQTVWFQGRSAQVWNEHTAYRFHASHNLSSIYRRSDKPDLWAAAIVQFVLTLGNYLLAEAGTLLGAVLGHFLLSREQFLYTQNLAGFPWWKLSVPGYLHRVYPSPRAVNQKGDKGLLFSNLVKKATVLSSLVYYTSGRESNCILKWANWDWAEINYHTQTARVNSILREKLRALLEGTVQGVPFWAGCVRHAAAYMVSPPYFSALKPIQIKIFLNFNSWSILFAYGESLYKEWLAQKIQLKVEILKLNSQLKYVEWWYLNNPDFVSLLLYHL